MSKILYFQVRKAVEQWLADNELNFRVKNIEIEEVKNTPEQLYIILKFSQCLAAIVVAKNTFAPYRCVSFEMGDIINGTNKMIYCWYDNENTTIHEVITNLDIAINFAVDYNNKISQR